MISYHEFKSYLLFHKKHNIYIIVINVLHLLTFVFNDDKTLQKFIDRNNMMVSFLLLPSCTQAHALSFAQGNQQCTLKYIISK